MNQQTTDSASATDVVIELRGLHVVFERHTVLRDIHLAVPRGQTLAIIGESGCGKTVLLKTMIRLIKPTRGAVYFNGVDLAGLSEKELTGGAASAWDSCSRTRPCSTALP